MRKEILSEINAILGNISGALGVERSTVFVVNEEKNTLDSLISQGLSNNLISMPLDCGIAGHVAKTKQPQIINDVAQSPLFNPYFDNITGFVTQKALCAPILNSTNEVVGVIQSLNKVGVDFNQRDLEILRSFADVLALAFKNAKLYSSAEAMKNDIATLLKVSSAINSELDLSNLIKLIMQKTSEITNSDRSSFFLLDEEENVLWTKFGEGLGSKIIKTRKGLAAQVVKTKQPIIENNPYDNPHFDKSVDAEIGYLTKSIISVPVFNSMGTLIGVIQSMNKKKGAFSNKDLFILNGFAAQISIAIQNSTLFEEINNIKNYLNILFENLDNGILTVDKNGVIKTVNKRFCDIIGTDKNELIGKYYKNLDTKHFGFLDFSDYTFRSGEKFEKQNVESLGCNQQKLVLNFSALPMKNKSDANIGVINVIHDITTEERVRENLNRYLPQHVINEIINKDDLSLFNGQYKKCSILFSDIRSFTSLTEQMEAIEIVDFLNNYFDIMVECIFQHYGVLDKLIGDAIMATFGIPYNSDTDALNAANTAMQMIDNLKLVNSLQPLPIKLDIGVGIATGNVISGNIGSKKRFEYTVIGDSVNLASRLESLTKFYGLNILMCETTYKAVTDHFICREIDRIKVHGKQKPETIYTVFARANQDLEKKDQLFLDLYSKGLKYYRDCDFDNAAQHFRRALFFSPQDKPTQIFLSRSKQFLIMPPELNWGGIWAFAEK
jgi:adenylate cyclase